MRLYCFKENRLFCEPTSSATRTGGLNFLIADAPLIMCHSLFPQATNQADMFACPFGGAYLLGGTAIYQEQHYTGTDH